MFPFNQGRVKLNKDEHWHKSSPSSFLFVVFTLLSFPLALTLSLFFPVVLLIIHVYIPTLDREKDW